MHKRDQTKYRLQRRLLYRIKAGAPVGTEEEKKTREKHSKEDGNNNAEVENRRGGGEVA